MGPVGTRVCVVAETWGESYSYYCCCSNDRAAAFVVGVTVMVAVVVVDDGFDFVVDWDDCSSLSDGYFKNFNTKWSSHSSNTTKTPHKKAKHRENNLNIIT